MIRIKGARTHNLKNIHLEIPRNRLIVITGLSGSGKSSLAFDTIFAEGQRRYVESLSAYARQFLTRIEKPDVDRIEGLSPAISIDQKATSHNPRSTVGTVTEIHDYLRLLYARAATPCCPQHGEPLEAETVGQMCDRLMALPENTRVMLLAPLVRGRKGEYTRLLEHLRMQGYVRARIDGALCELDAAPPLDLRRKHTIEVVVDRLKIRPGVELRVAESLEIALRLADGLALAAPMDGGGDEVLLSAKFACPRCGYTLGELEPRLFSFNNPAGACPECDGLGTVEYFDEDKIVNPALSIAGGAVRGRDRRNRQYLETMQALAEHYRFDIEAPFESLPEDIRSVILYGGGDEVVFHYRDSADRRVRRRHPFTGVIAGMERRYEETGSDKVREELRRYLSLQACPECDGERLNTAARHVVLQGARLPEISAMTIADALAFFGRLKLPGVKAEIAGKIVAEIHRRLQFLVNVGLDYLSLGRSAETLSGGEAQRIRLASQIGSGLVGVMYILDEPSIGLHQRDNRRLLDTLTELRDLGNTVIVVEHDEEAVRSADHIIDIGPGAGEHGGRVVAQGTPRQIEKKSASLTGQYLAGRRRIEVPRKRTPANPKRRIKIRKASGNNLKNINVEIPLGLLVAVTGVSGSGKSTLVNETLYKHAARRLNGGAHLMEAPCEEILGIEQIDKVIDVNQSPIGKTPRSNPATYTGLFTPIRELFAATPEARSRGYTPGRFSFNVKGGRCEACRGGGLIRVEMHFLPDIYVTCDICRGKRYNRETLDIRYKGKNTSEVLDMTVEEARAFFDAVPAVRNRLQTLMDVGLSYVKLGQNSTTLSGGEAQRVKLSRELSRRDTGRTLYILDEPTTGLHFHDIEQLLQVLYRLRDGGNTIVVIEHNLDVIKTADWIIDLGPEGGARGGRVVAAATPEDIVRRKGSWTGRYLKKHL
ncbi:MAG: excinuclease ABC subunit UvrA [Gammaproteobacteria bacterium]|nr:excinuclease ABC subunit UvrA [Gammaproteobacteria bacterium]MDD9886604.1 excinuclease ABC subunit UvrA [Gammaproteobacteria bacterium]